ncbi:MAG: putative extracellular deoxyribonuclease [Myxococcales bacterium]|nr:putative extracellular deoxyribonuclease [Myxococcales bacterium]
MDRANDGSGNSGDANQTDGRVIHDGQALGSDAPIQQATTPLLLSEVVLVGSGKEYIEIVNPTTAPVDLSQYYVSDNGNYFKLPLGVATAMANNFSGDFIAKFPAGSTIDAHGVVTVAIGTAALFTTTYGVAPTYSIADATLTVLASSTPSLTDTGEIVVLFQWDGYAPLVKDVDMVLAGVPTPANAVVSKSGVSQSGAMYATDANTLPAQATAPAAGKSTKRLMLETGHETQLNSGNGIDGDDETSEQTTTTWDTTAMFGAPTPGAVPTALLQ